MAAITDFFHGIQFFVLEDEAPAIVIRKSSVIGAVITAGIGPVNTPTLVIGNFRRAVNIFGENHTDGFTGPEAFKGIFDQGSATVIAVNVCDPAVHKTDVTDEEITFDKTLNTAKTEFPYHTAMTLSEWSHVFVKFNAQNWYALPAGVTLSSVKNSEGTAYSNSTDYELEVVDGISVIRRLTTGTIGASTVVRVSYHKSGGFVLDTDYKYSATHGKFTRIPGGSLIAGSVIKVNTYTYTDPTKVTDADVIGATLEGEVYTGIQALPRASARLKISPRILIAPRFTQDVPQGTYATPNVSNAVISALNIVARQVNGRVIASAPNIDIQTAVDSAAFFSGPEDRVYMHYPNYLVSDPDSADGEGVLSQPACARLAGVLAVNDGENGFWDSISNHEVFGIRGMDKQLTWSLQDANTDVNYLNSVGIASTIFENGFRTWGNRECNMKFQCVSRTSDIINESIVYSQLYATDRGIRRGLLTMVVSGVVRFLRYLEILGAILPNPNPTANNDAWADPELNPASAVKQGKLRVDYRYNPVYPAESITFGAHITDAYIVGVFTT